MRIEDLSPAFKTLHYGIGDWAEPEEQKKGIHDVRRFKTYPAFPWKFDGTDHSQDNAAFFYGMCEQAGIAKHVSAEEEHRDNRPISYREWVERHKNEPGWVNHLEDYGKK